MGKDVEIKKYLSHNTIIGIKFIAIILMLIHHFWGFESYVLPDNAKFQLTFGEVDIDSMVGQFSKICVAIFAFITGYTMYFSRNKYIMAMYRVKKGLKLLISYWVVFAIILIIGYLASEPMPSVTTLIWNLFGFKAGIGENYMYVSSCFAWYVGFYLEFLLTAPLLIKMCSNKSFLVNIIKIGAMFIVLVVLAKILPIPGAKNVLGAYASYGCTIMIGYVIAAFSIFEKIKNQLGYLLIHNWVRIIFNLSIIVCVALVRSQFNSVSGSIGVDFIYVPIFVFCISSIGKCLKPFVLKVFLLIKLVANQSMNIWFLHAIFFMPYRRIQWFAYWPHYGVLIIIWVTLILLCASLIITKAEKNIQNFVMKKLAMMEEIYGVRPRKKV